MKYSVFRVKPGIIRHISFLNYNFSFCFQSFSFLLIFLQVCYEILLKFALGILVLFCCSHSFCIFTCEVLGPRRRHITFSHPRCPSLESLVNMKKKFTFRKIPKLSLFHCSGHLQREVQRPSASGGVQDRHPGVQGGLGRYCPQCQGSSHTQVYVFEILELMIYF